MLERLAAWFLNTYVAEYVENVLKEQLSIGLLKGAVELEKLPLKRDALKKLKLPVEVKSGYIGKLKLQIPVRYIKSQPWVVQIDQLYIIIGPPRSEDYDAEAEEEQSQAKKQAKLDKLEQEWKAEQRTAGNWWFQKWLPLTTSFPSNVVANLQVIVNDVHIRYEDSDADPSHPFAVGIMLERMSAQSTDGTWEPKFVTGEEKARKLFDLQNFSVYWDRETLGDVEGQELVDALCKKHGSVTAQEDPMTASTMSGLQPPTEFVIRPVSGCAKLTRNSVKTPLRIVDGPRFHLDVQLGEIPVVLTDQQYQTLVGLFEVVNLRLRAQRYRKWRPSAPVAESPQLWWQFATNCVLHRVREMNRRASLNFVLTRARQNVGYVEAYTAHLTQATVSDEVREQLQLIEKEQSFEELAVLRKVAMATVKRERDLEEAAKRQIESESSESNQGVLQRWFPGWISGYPAKGTVRLLSDSSSSPGDDYRNGDLENEEPDSGELLERGVDSSEEGELLEELGYEEQDNSLFLRDRIFLTLAFSLSKGSFQLVTNPPSDADTAFLGPEPLVELGFSSLCCAADVRPRLRFVSFDLSLGSVTVEDHVDQDSKFPILVQPKGAELVSDREQLFQRQYTVDDPRDVHSSSSALFSLRVVQEEVKHQKHYQLRVHSKPLDIVYNPSTIAQVRGFFMSPLSRQNTVHQLQRELQSHTAAELKHRLEGILEGENELNDHRVSVKLDVSAPHIILPEDFNNKETTMVILDLGHLTFANVRDWSEEEQLGMQDMESAIDEDDDDEFVTPLSSPPSETAEDSPDGGTEPELSRPVPPEQLSDALRASVMELQNDPYDRYVLSLSDLQVLVGKVDENWREAVRSGRSRLHLLDKFTLSVRIQRMLNFSPEALEPNLSLAASLPSLSFHVDEQKVHSLISCLQPLHLPEPTIQASDPTVAGSPQETPSSSLSSPPYCHPAAFSEKSDLATSIYKSAYAPEGLEWSDGGETTMGASMFQSAMGTSFWDSTGIGGTRSTSDRPSPSSRLTSTMDTHFLRERHQRKLLVAGETLLRAQLSIDEVNLSLSSRGMKIVDLSVPGVCVSVTKRPYDIDLRLLVQDLCLVDRIQTFGPEYELVVCSSGKSLLSSPFGEPPAETTHTETTSSFDHRSQSCPDFNSLGPKSQLSGTFPERSVPAVVKEGGALGVSSSSSRLPTDIFLATATADQSDALLSLCYTRVGPYSPLHPARRELIWEEKEQANREATIQKVNVKCTAVDAIANQETVVELVSFLRRAIPEKLLPDGGDAMAPSQADTNVQALQRKLVERPIQTEVKLEFERLSVRMLRKVRKRSRRRARPSASRGAGPVGQLIANFTFYGVAIEGKISTDQCIQGRLEGVRITDLTSVGKKYSDIVSMGLQTESFVIVESSVASEGRPSQHDPQAMEGPGRSSQRDPQAIEGQNFFSFSVTRSPRTANCMVSSTEQLPHDVRLSAFVPSIHYTHSVNFVYEMEMFVSDFQFYSEVLTNSFKSAAVGVAKGLVREKSQLAEGLGKLSTSFGPASARSSFSQPTTNHSFGQEHLVTEEPDIGMPVAMDDRICFNVSVQSPVIVLPRTLRGDDCLIAHLGEISIKNEFLSRQNDFSLTEDALTSIPELSSPEVDRMVLKIENMSLHASHDQASRDWLLSKDRDKNSCTSGHWIKVLNETSFLLRIDRSVGDGTASTTSGERSDENLNDSFPAGTDVVITGEIRGPLLIYLPKQVFDQFKSTLKHGIRKKVSPTAKPGHRLASLGQVGERPTASTAAAATAASLTSSSSSSVSKAVRFKPEVESVAEERGESLPSIFASFTLPKLSLELKHTIGGKERNVVYISFEEFSVQCNLADSYVTSCNLALRSVIIEDLLQEEDSEYRYILASSSKPLPFMSPVSSPRLRLPAVSKTQGLGAPFSRSLLPVVKLMSTPRARLPSESPLRSFSPYEDRKPTEKSEGAFGGNHDDESEKEDSSTTLQGDASRFSDIGDLVTIKAVFVDDGCPEYATKYNSVFGHASVEFNSVYVIVNLQTWVVLFDYLGIGIPTPPPSRPDTPTDEEDDSFRAEQVAASLHAASELLSSQTLGGPSLEQGLWFGVPPMQTGVDSLRLGHSREDGTSARKSLSPSVLIDKSFQEDARDFCSLGSDDGSRRDGKTTEEKASKRGTQNDEGVGKPAGQSTAQDSIPSGASAGEGEDGGEESSAKATVWGVEGKLSLDVKLHVRSLTVTFNKPEHPLARGTASSLQARVGVSKGNVHLTGSLGQASVIDLTETGCYYRERFTTTGDEALNFEIFKYGRPDPLMERPFDISARVKMASVRYLHTMRFLKEILAFCSHFPQLIDAFQRMKAMAQGNLVYFGPERKARISLDVDAAGPILLIPKHALSPELMVGDIGHVRVTNKTLYDGQDGTITFLRKQQEGEEEEEEEDEEEEESQSVVGSGDGVDLKMDSVLSPQGSVQSQLSTITIGEASMTQSQHHYRPQRLGAGSISSSVIQGSVFSHVYEGSSFVTARSPNFPPWGTGWSTHYPHLSSSQSSADAGNSIFGSGVHFAVEQDKRQIEEKLEAVKGPCLLDCIELILSEVDVFSARRVEQGANNFKIVRQPGKVLKEKGAAKIFIERNLHEDFCRDVPDFHIEGTLAAIHVMLDKSQLELVKGLIDMNLGEGIEEFEKPSTVIQDPVAQPVAADVWIGFLFRMRFVGVQLEFLDSRESDTPGSLTRSLALFDIQQSEFSFESRSNQSKTVDFTSQAVIGYDTRYQDYEDAVKPSVFSEVLTPTFKNRHVMKKSIQVEIHVTFSPTYIKASILLNRLRLMGIFDLILALKSFVIDKIPEEEMADDFDDVDSPSLSAVGTLRQRLASRQRPQAIPEEKKPDRDIRLNLSVTETDFVVVEDMTSLDSNAVVLKGTLILQFRSLPNKAKTLHCSIDGLELFSCSLSNEEESALSILDPVSVTMEIKPPDVHSRRSALTQKSSLVDAMCTQTLEVEVRQLNFRLSYNDIKLFLAIAQSLPPLTPLDQHMKRESSSLKLKEGDIDESLVKRLLPLGFTRAAIRRQLYLSNGDPDVAAEKLLEQLQREEEEVEEEEEEGWSEQELTEWIEGEGEEEEEGRAVGGKGEEEGEEGEKGKAFTIGSIEVVIESLSVCLIDDCVNRDVPLLDFSLSQLQAEHDLLVQRKGSATAIFSGEYYNRNISAWEPVVEPWRLQFSWEKVKKFSTDLDSNAQPDRLSLSLSSPEKLCLNVSSSLIHILRTTQANWSQDIQSGQNGERIDTEQQLLQYQTHRRTNSGRFIPDDLSGGVVLPPSKAISSMERGLALLHSVRFVSQTRQRARFVPFVLRNSTGLPLRFATLTSLPSKVYVSPSALYQRTRGAGKVGGAMSELGRTSEWMDVAPGKEKPFDFSAKGKLRHRDTRALIVHQLLVKVAGWQRIVIPISVDKIGVFFREVEPCSDSDYDSLAELPLTRGIVRLVFAISLSDTQKVVNVRSALVLQNTMELPLEVRLENPIEEEEEEEEEDEWGRKSERRLVVAVNGGTSVVLPVLGAKGYLAIPLHLTSWNVRVRPQGWGVQFCSKQLAWKHVVWKAPPTSHTRACEAIGEGEEPPFRFCVSVKRENYPPDPPQPSASPPHPLTSLPSPCPAHTLSLYPPLTAANLLPCDIQFYLPYNGVRKIIRMGREIAVYSVDSTKTIEFKVTMDNFVTCQSCTISLEDVGVIQTMTMEDSNGRPLRLTVTLEVLGGTAMKVSISCPYWLINRTGLPLVFRQEGVGYNTAGQSKEHERASTTTPLLFSYAGGETVEKCMMRLGQQYPYLCGGQPNWCYPFRMLSESGVIRVFVRSTDGRPDKEYQIGVDIRRGGRQYQGTRVVTFVARYQLENRTQYRLAYLQRHQLQDEKMLSEAKKILFLMPNAILQFHWPRTDLDKLLTIRVGDIGECHWSGGFSLDKDYSFHVNMRGNFGHSIFVRCEVTLKGATYHVVFSDAASYPPPFRLENLSQMSVTYFQSGIAKTLLYTTLNPGQSVPYAWDEPMIPERLCLQVRGTQEIKEFTLDKFGPQGKLYYESYIYVTALATFPSTGPSVFHTSAYFRGEYPELVLDVPQGTAVIFRRKNPDRRTQLWRMTPSRQLVHIASSTSETNVVLDIASNRLPTHSGQFVNLIVRRASSYRADTQMWRFTEDGHLLLANNPKFCVQSRTTEYQRFREGADVVLGHVEKAGNDGSENTPPEQKFRRLKHSPGSGVLSVNVVSDGPTRILRITDVNKKYTHTTPRDDWVVVDHGLVAPTKSTDVDSNLSWENEEEGENSAMELELSLVLEQGVGISLINSVAEELLFASLTGIRVDFVNSSSHQCLNAIIQYIQVDNQLPLSPTPVLAYPTPSSSEGEPECSYPVLRVFAEKVPHKSPFAIVFKELEVQVGEMTLLLEEKLLFKLIQWAGVGGARGDEKEEDEIINMLTQRYALPPSSHVGMRQLYFEWLQIKETELRVSMHTTSQLPEDLQRIKRRVGISLVKFESPVFLGGFRQAHMLGPVAVYTDALVKHYKRELTGQAIRILGSVDFLGNPVGLFIDVASGVSGMIATQPDVVGLVRDVAHGMSDTTSKLTGTVSHVLGQATFDSSFQEEREQLLESCQTSRDHLKAGLIGLTSGVLGGVTSLITQPYKGAQEYGIGGFFTGVGKGILGTVAKPVAGFFDLASGTSAALRETTSRVSRIHPPPVRHRRCCVGPSGALTCYSISQARGQEYLMRLTDGELTEKLVSYELLSELQRDRMKVIISSQYLYFFRDSPPDPSSIEAKISLDDLVECRPAQGKTSIPTTYIVVSLVEKHREGAGETTVYRAPKFKCSDERRAKKIAQLINYAKNLHEEEKHIVRTLRLQQDTIW